MQSWRRSLKAIVGGFLFFPSCRMAVSNSQGDFLWLLGWVPLRHLWFEFENAEFFQKVDVCGGQAWNHGEFLPSESQSACLPSAFPDRARFFSTNVLRKPDFRESYCRAGVPPAIERVTLAGESPALHLEVQKQSAFGISRSMEIKKLTLQGCDRKAVFRGQLVLLLARLRHHMGEDFHACRLGKLPLMPIKGM
jgi:hypothetical protein